MAPQKKNGSENDRESIAGSKNWGLLMFVQEFCLWVLYKKKMVWKHDDSPLGGPNLLVQPMGGDVETLKLMGLANLVLGYTS